jgi:hypothetical protein
LKQTNLLVLGVALSFLLLGSLPASGSYLASKIVVIDGITYQPEYQPPPNRIAYDQQTFYQHLEHLNPELRRYITDVYFEYNSSTIDKSAWMPIHRYVYKTMKDSANYWKRYKRPITSGDVYRVVWGVKKFSTKWGLDEDLAFSYLTQESGFLDIIGDLVNVKTHQRNPPSSWSLGVGQVQLSNAIYDLRKRGINPTGLTTNDLIYFKLLNLNVSIHIMAGKIKQYGTRGGLYRYNGGPSYAGEVLKIYAQRKSWK